MATWSNIIFQDSTSPLMEQLIFFHDHTMMIIIMITTLILYMFLMLIFNSYKNRFLMEGQEIEIIWTIIPAITLIFIAFPSLRLLYLLDEINDPSITLKIIGHQWFWSYEYSDFPLVEFDSFMVGTEKMNHFRLLDVSSHIFLPLNNQIRTLITAADVLHAWTMPSMGIKVDAIPGRLNQASFYISRVGLWFGQCSEICGANHSFMPIVIESTPIDMFIMWVKSFKYFK